MKNRLLEDIGDSQSGAPVGPPPRAPKPPEATTAPPAQADGPPDRQRPGVWRSRTSAPSRPRATQAPETSTPSAAAIPPDIASFSSREPDWSVPLRAEPPSWSERWGRKALGWTLGVAAVVAVGATAAWMVRETEVQSTLAVVAGQSPAQASLEAPALAAAPLSEPEAEALPPLKLLPPEQAGTARPAAGNASGAEQTAPAEKPAAETSVAQSAAEKPAAGPAKKPAVEAVRERRVAAAGAGKSRQPDTRKPAPKQAREAPLARAPAPPARAVAAPDPQSPLSETLRLCRAAGYHATACLKRGCEATRFGLVCRG